MTIKKTKFDLTELELENLSHKLNSYPVGINAPWHYEKDYSILKEFTDEELAQELLRRTSLGKELE